MLHPPPPFPLIALLALVASSALAADHPSVIRLGVPGVAQDGYSPIVSGVVGTVAGKGLIEEEFSRDGIKIEWSFFKGAGPALNEALANGFLDFGVGLGDLPATVHRATGLKTQILLGTSRLNVNYLVVPADSPAHSLADLKGKHIAVFKGTATQLTFNRILQSEGFTEKDFKVINLDSATSRNAIATRDVDAYLASQDAFALVARGIARIIYTTRGRNPTLESTAALLVTDDFEQAYPALVQRLVDVIVKEAAWSSTESNRLDILKWWAKSGLPYNFFREDLGADPLAYRNDPLLDAFFVQHYLDARDQSRNFKLIRSDFAVEPWINRTYLDHAIKAQALEGFWPEFDGKGNLVKPGRQEIEARNQPPR